MQKLLDREFRKGLIWGTIGGFGLGIYARFVWSCVIWLYAYAIGAFK